MSLRYPTTSGSYSTRFMVEAPRSSWDQTAAHRCLTFEAKAFRLSRRGCEQGLCLNRLQPPPRVTHKFHFFTCLLFLFAVIHQLPIWRFQMYNFGPLTPHLNQKTFSSQKMSINTCLSKVDDKIMYDDLWHFRCKIQALYVEIWFLLTSMCFFLFQE